MTRGSRCSSKRCKEEGKERKEERDEKEKTIKENSSS
jgi:hypothetical protein